MQYPAVAIEITHPWENMYNFIPEGSGIAPPIDRNYVENDYFPNYLMRRELQPNETYTYGSRINKVIEDLNIIKNADNRELQITQLDRVVDMLKKTPLTNQAVIEIASPDDLVECYGNDGKLDPPCLRLIDFKVFPTFCQDFKNGECNSIKYAEKFCPKLCEWKTLTMSVYFRSWDLWAGFPSNLCGLELLKQYVASECNLINGAMFAYSSGLHIYGYQEEIAKLRLHRSK